jgi:hypothetical protein
MQHAIDVIEAERDELRSGLLGHRPRLVQMAKSGELKMAARRYKAA